MATLAKIIHTLTFEISSLLWNNSPKKLSGTGVVVSYMRSILKC